MYKILLIGFSGLLGTLARYWLSGWVDERWGLTFPVGTVVVNLLGCFAIGFLFHSWEKQYFVDQVIRAAVLVGFLGGFTTFSSFALQSFFLMQNGDFVRAGGNILISNAAGLVFVWAGFEMARLL